MYHKVFNNHSLIQNIYGSIKSGTLLDSLFDKNGIASTDLTNGIKQVWENAKNNKIDIFEDVQWGNMQQKQIKIVTARLRELGEQGKLTAMDVGSITSSFESMSKNNFLKTLGSTLKDFALNFVASAGISVAISLVMGLIGKLKELHKTQEELIQDGEEAQQSIKSTYEEFQKGQQSIKNLGSQFADQNKTINSTGDAIDAIAQKYHELSKGVNSANENIGLSSDEYKDYLNISNQLAEQMASLISGYDAQGNAILNLLDNVVKATHTLHELYDAEMLAAHVEIGEKLGASCKGYNAKTKGLNKENKGIGAELKEIKKQIKKYSDTTSVMSLSNTKLNFSMDALGKNSGKFRQEISKTLSEMNVQLY